MNPKTTKVSPFGRGTMPVWVLGGSPLKAN